MAQKLTWWIVGAMLVGVAVGAWLHAIYPAGGADLAGIVDMLKLLPDIFMKLIKMIIAPLVLGTIVTGIAGMGDSAALGRIGAKAIGWFLISSLISLSLGMALVNLFQPGVGLAMQVTAPVGELATQQLNLRHFLLEVFPASAIEAMAVNNVLQILVFSLFAGVALAAIGPAGAPLLQVADPLAKLRELHQQRHPLYEETAHYSVDTGRPSVGTLVNMILMQLEMAGVVPASNPGPIAGPAA